MPLHFSRVNLARTGALSKVSVCYQSSTGCKKAQNTEFQSCSIQAVFVRNLLLLFSEPNMMQGERFGGSLRAVYCAFILVLVSIKRDLIAC